MNDNENNIELVTLDALGETPPAAPEVASIDLSMGVTPNFCDGAPETVPLETTPSEVDAKPASEDLRTRMLRQFEEWLDGMLADPPAPPPVPQYLINEALAETSGEPSASGPDLYTLFAALTGLAGEIGLQGRAFKQLTDSLAPIARLPEGIEALGAAQHAAAREIERLADELQPGPDEESSLPASKDVLGVIFDLLERLERGLQTFDAGIESIRANQPRGFAARLAGADKYGAQTLQTLKAMNEGYHLTLSRLLAAVDQWGIHRVGKAGDMFDPTTMVAVDVDTASARPPGSVVEVYRSGYVLHGQMLATTQVKVAK